MKTEKKQISCDDQTNCREYIPYTINVQTNNNIFKLDCDVLLVQTLTSLFFSSLQLSLTTSRPPCSSQPTATQILRWPSIEEAAGEC